MKKLSHIMYLLFLFLGTSCLQNNIDVNQNKLKSKVKTYDIKGSISKISNLIFPSAYASEIKYCLNEAGPSNKKIEVYAVFSDSSEKFLCSGEIDDNGDYNIELIQDEIDSLGEHYIKISVINESDTTKDGLLVVGTVAGLTKEADINADISLRSIPLEAELANSMGKGDDLANIETLFVTDYRQSDVFKMFKIVMQGGVVEAKEIKPSHFEYLRDIKDSVLLVVKDSIKNNNVNDPTKSVDTNIKESAVDIQCALIFDYKTDLYSNEDYVANCANSLNDNTKQIFNQNIVRLYDVIVKNMSIISNEKEISKINEHYLNFTESFKKDLVADDKKAISALPIFKFLVSQIMASTLDTVKSSKTIEDLHNSVVYQKFVMTTELTKMALKQKRNPSLYNIFTLIKSYFDYIEDNTSINPEVLKYVVLITEKIANDFHTKTALDDLKVAPLGDYYKDFKTRITGVREKISAQKDLALYYSKDEVYVDLIKNLDLILGVSAANSMTLVQYMEEVYKSDFYDIEYSKDHSEVVTAFKSIVVSVKNQSESKTKLEDMKEGYPKAYDAFIELSKLLPELENDLDIYLKSSKAQPSIEDQSISLKKSTKYEKIINLNIVMMNELK